MPNSGKNMKNGNKSSKKQIGTSRQSNKPVTKTKAILKLKPSRKPEQTIKATFLVRNENEVKELVYTFDDGDPKDNIILIVSQLFQLAKRYNL
jgi:hypothetical protein